MPLRSATHETELMNRASTIWRAENMFCALVSRYARSIPQHPAKVRLIKLMAGWGRSSAWVYQHEATKARFSGEPGDFIGWELLTKGSFEPASLTKCRDLMQEHGGWFADIGAHHGLFSSVVSSLPMVDVLSFEPNPASFLKLLANIRLNGRTNVHLVHAALGSQPTLLPWQHSGSGDGTTAWSHGVRDKEAGDYHVAAVRFRDVVDKFGWAAPTLIKMDVEGAEIAALQGFDFEALRPKFVLMEAQPQWQEKFVFMSTRGYGATGEGGTKLYGGEDDLFLEGNALFTEHRSQS